MSYPPHLTDPMRDDLVRIGVTELRTPAEVDGTLTDSTGSVLVFVNSVCGCAAGMARPGLALSLTNDVVPDKVTTVFAGVDKEATQQARSYFGEYPPSSPQIALFKDGQVVNVIQRHQIEGTTAQDVAGLLTAAYDAHCSKQGAS